MANRFDAITLSTIFSHISDLIHREKMGLALEELRGILDDLHNNNHQFQYFWNNNQFKEETTTFINFVHFDLEIVEAWNYFMINTVPFTPVANDLNCFDVLHGVRDYIENNILGDIFANSWGLSGYELDDVTDYLDWCVARGDQQLYLFI